jgi:hypothetical protein
MSEGFERGAQLEALRLVKEFGDEAPLYAAFKAQRAIERRDFTRCARWKRVLEILDEEQRQHQDMGRQDVASQDIGHH